MFFDQCALNWNQKVVGHQENYCSIITFRRILFTTIKQQSDKTIFGYEQQIN